MNLMYETDAKVVTPAEAGVQSHQISTILALNRCLDSRLRGNDSTSGLFPKAFFKGLRALSLSLLLISFSGKTEAAVYEASLSALQGGHYILVFSNRDLSQRRAEVRVKVYEKNSQRTFDFPVQNVEVAAGELNPITRDLARAGAKMINFNLKDSGFTRFARIETVISTEGTLPNFTWVTMIAESHEGKVLCYADRRMFRERP